MKVFKNTFFADLTQDQLNKIPAGEVIVTKSKFGGIVFDVYQKTIYSKLGDGITDSIGYPFLAGVQNLKLATSLSMFVEEENHKYEYYTQKQEEPKEQGSDKESMMAMGELGWELCSIDGRSYIYKRKIFK